MKTLINPGAPLAGFACSQHFACIRINRRHTRLEAYILMPFSHRQLLWRQAAATQEQKLALYLAEGFPPLGVGRLPALEQQGGEQ